MMTLVQLDFHTTATIAQLVLSTLMVYLTYVLIVITRGDRG